MAAADVATLHNGSEGPRTRWKYLDRILDRPGPFTDPESFVPGNHETLEIAKVLVIGAGGLGCEVLKNLALSGFKDIHVIDMDTIDVSNLNRQFLFRAADVGKYKAEVAAAFVEKRVKGVKITPYCGKIQDKDEAYYKQFALIVCGLDSIEARRWINSMLVGMVDGNDPDSMKPLIDGGTEGFKGQAKVIFPTMTSCIECQLDMHAPRAAVPLCTLATIPRQPQHCIEWAHIIAWEEERKEMTLDTDDPEHITWLFQKALKRAKEFNIPGVTYSMTQGVVKNIIPAIASTNAIVAASCCNEAFKILTNANPFLGFPETDGYMMYTGDESVYTYTFEYKKKEDCPVCGEDALARPLQIDPEATLQEFVDSLAERPEAQLKTPSIRTTEKSLYIQSAADYERMTRPNLEKKMKDLTAEGEEMLISDKAFPMMFKFVVVWKK
ncbi:NEDD8-activating enzyme E1 catalytic subunit [Karstenula rhodostoma CBS 690.94]|uniref:NEDD8-activating enzyme E1 catalytic subunit n=1 Tax=Karstenula rhodostoma CBS 690.94 TaxID=1392251 RepID=A0A9P4P6E1_9PLEO|nr:NEDD8-activating enzyme E1 catalytic subunit [Karstenula rhodostoma CBS 690.94]